MQHRVVAGIKTVRSDLSEWVWHFVNRGQDAFTTLKTILNDRKLLGSYDRYSSSTVISFTEAPAYEFARQSRVLNDHGYPRLSDYGIGFRKQWLFEHGGLPVIYQPQALLDRFHELPSEYRFRHVPYDPTAGIDYTWQREWRVHSGELPFSRVEAVVIVPSFDEAEGLLYDVEEDGDYIDGEAVTFPSIVPYWSYIAHDQFCDITDINDNVIEMSIRAEFDEKI